MTRRILLVGASGAFGRKLAGLLARWDEVDLVLAARRRGPLDDLADALRRSGAKAGIEVATFARDRPDPLPGLRPWAVVDAAGPFQGADLTLARAAIAAGAHYVDLADARDFVAAFPQLDAEARARGVLAITGASSTPALSNAALDAITKGWLRIDRATVAISPGSRAPWGRSVVRAILSYVGRPVRVWREGAWGEAPGWSGLRRLDFPGLGHRWAALCETPDLDVLAARATQSGEFLAGLELATLHLGLWLLSWPVRLGLVSSLSPLSQPLGALSGLFGHLGSDRGGMVVMAQGQGPAGEPLHARWGLWAEANAGPNVPVAAAAATLRKLLSDGFAERGARVCLGLVTVEAILAELSGLPIHTRRDEAAPASPVLMARVVGRAVSDLPASVVAIHGSSAPATFHGAGRAKGSRSLPVRAMRAILRVPQPGTYPRLTVIIAPDRAGETWTRSFGAQTFTSRLVSLAAPGRFQERFGPLRFEFSADLEPTGFRWRFVRWGLGRLPLPGFLAPRIRAASFEKNGVYRFRAMAAHPWFGLLFAYAGWLQ